jgi:archaemetzincin
VTDTGAAAARLALVPLGAVDDALLHALGAELEERHSLACTVAARRALHATWREPLTRRVRSAAVLDALAGAGEGEWRLGVTEAVLRGDGTGDVFGQADAGTQCAVVSLAPLREGRGSEPDVFLARLLAVAMHELGHLAGLGHCASAGCVMYSSAHIADTDRKGSAFCRACARNGGAFARRT